MSSLTLPRQRPFIDRLPRLSLTLAFVAAALATYVLVLHPWLMDWGATPTEQAMTLPGDEFAGSANHRFTRAVTVHAPAEQVWPWLLQIGQDRAGFYSNDWLENLTLANIHNGDTLRPEWQNRALGDGVRMAADDYMGGLGGEATKTRIRVLESGRAIGDTPGLFALQPVDAKTTRLLLREYFTEPTDLLPLLGTRLVNWLAWDPMHFVMEKGMLLGIQARAEGRPVLAPAVEIAARLGWVAMTLAVLGVFVVQRRWLALALPAVYGLAILGVTHDADSAMAGFLALGITILGVRLFGRRWWPAFLALAAVVLLVLVVTPQPWAVFGLVFLALLALAAAYATFSRTRARKASTQ